MEFETGRSPALQITPRQRWSIAFSYVLVALGLVIGISLRDSSLRQSSLYANIEAGISALYPARWLLEETGGDFVFRVRDMSNRAFNTVIEVTTKTIGPDGVERNLLDQLSLRRAQFLIDYTVLAYDTYVFPDESSGVTMSYAYVSRDANPFLEGVSALVRGLDILTIRRGQALIISLRADVQSFERELETLRWFTDNLEF